MAVRLLRVQGLLTVVVWSTSLGVVTVYEAHRQKNDIQLNDKHSYLLKHYGLSDVVSYIA
jgi:hypothetical protein